MTVHRWRYYLAWGNPLVQKLGARPLSPEEVERLLGEGYTTTIVGSPMDKHKILLRPGEDGERDRAVMEGRSKP